MTMTHRFVPLPARFAPLIAAGVCWRDCAGGAAPTRSSAGAVGVRVECNVPDATVWIDDLLAGSAERVEERGAPDPRRLPPHRDPPPRLLLLLPGGRAAPPAATPSSTPSSASCSTRPRPSPRPSLSRGARGIRSSVEITSQNSIWRGTLYGARLRAQWSMMSSARQTPARTTRATTIGPPRSSVTTRACAAFTLGNASRQPSTSPSATRLPSTLTRSSSRPVMIDAARPCPAGRGRRCAASRRRRRRRSATPSPRLGRWIFGHRHASTAPRERTQIGPSSPAGSRSPFGAGDAQLDAVERPCRRSPGPCPPRSIASGPACVRVVAGEQPDPEPLRGTPRRSPPAAPSPSCRKRAPPVLSGLTVGTRTSEPNSAGVPAKKSIVCSRSSLAMRFGETSSSRNSVAPLASDGSRPKSKP